MDGRECDAPALADMHVWLLFFADDLALMSELEVGLQQQLDAFQQLCVERGVTMNVKKTKVMVFNFVDPCQEFVFEGDVIKHVQTFKYLGILLETTSYMDSAVEHLAIVNKHSLFALNRRCVKLRIMNVKLRYDLFNTLVRSAASYACEVWVDSKKIKAMEIVDQRFLKSLLRVRKITSMSIVLAEFGKYPFEHFAWGQALLYYNRMSTVTKDRILGKAWEAQLAMLAAGKKMLGWIREKIVIQASAVGGGRFFASGSTVIGNGASTCSDSCALGEDCSIVTRNGSWGNAHTFDPSSTGERLGKEPSALV